MIRRHLRQGRERFGCLVHGVSPEKVGVVKSKPPDSKELKAFVEKAKKAAGASGRVAMTAQGLRQLVQTALGCAVKST